MGCFLLRIVRKPMKLGDMSKDYPHVPTEDTRAAGVDRHRGHLEALCVTFGIECNILT